MEKISPVFELNQGLRYESTIPIIKANLKGEFIAVWHADSSGSNGSDYYNIYIQIFDCNGAQKNEPQKVSRFLNNVAYDSDFDLFVSDNFIITLWNNAKNEIWAQIFDSAVTPINENFKISSWEGGKKYFHSAIWQNKLYTTYCEDNGRILANIMDLQSYTKISFDDVKEPLNFYLCQNYPNPFNPETTIQYQLSNQDKVRLQIFSIDGKLIRTVADQIQSAGTHKIKWNGENNYGELVSSGIYIYRLEISNNLLSKEMIFLK